MTRLAVVTPFLDKQHGTERCVAEQVERLAQHYGYEIHVYSQRVHDIPWVPPNEARPGTIAWHKVPKFPGPHLLNFVWWFWANSSWRARDQKIRGVRYDLVYSPGINCLDADVTAVHIVFTEFYTRVHPALRLRSNPRKTWPHLLHRRTFYRLVMGLERSVYPRTETLIAISQKVANDLKRIYGVQQPIPVVYHGIDSHRFHSDIPKKFRSTIRQALGHSEKDFILLLIGNDWRKKGLPAVIEALGRLRQAGLDRIWLWVVGHDQQAPFESWMHHWGVAHRIRFLPPRPDIEVYYAGADLYVGPSLEDAFALPPAEAMACCLPVIVSRAAGVSEIITHEYDGWILESPEDSLALAHLIRRLYENPDLRHAIGLRAARTAQRFTWDRNAAEMHRLFQHAIEKKRSRWAESPIPQTHTETP